MDASFGKRHSLKPWRTTVVMLAAVALGPAPALADPPAEGAEDPEAREQLQRPRLDLDALVRDLDSELVEQRISASTVLTEHRAIQLPDLEEVLKRDDLSPEQRQRLLMVAEHRFRTEPRAALGFSGHALIGDHGQGVLISNVIDGFPAAEALRANDRMISANGQPLANFQAIRPVIVSRDPGDELDLVIIRDGATLNIRVALGSFRDLPDGGGLDEGVLAEAWQMRSQNLRGPRQEPVPSGLSPQRWLPERADDGQRRPVRHVEVAVQDDSRLGIVMGGEARGLGGDRLARAIQLIEGDDARQAQLNPILQQIRHVRLQIEARESQLASIDQMLDRDGLPERDRRQLEQTRSGLEQALRGLQTRLEGLLDDLEAIP